MHLKLQEARQRMPLRRLMEQRGKAPTNGNWKSFPRCPFCGHPGSAGVFSGRHGELFKCLYASCSSGTQHEKRAWDEIGFLAYELGLSRREAAFVWLRLAGL